MDIFLRCKKLVCLKNPSRTVLERKQGGKMSEGLVQFPKHNTRGFRWPWGKSWCLGHLPAASLAACSSQRKKPMKGHQSKREAGRELCTAQSIHTKTWDQWCLFWHQIPSAGLPLIPHRGQPLTLLPSHAMLSSDCKHSKDFHFQKYYINNFGIWNVLCIFKMKNWKIPPLSGILCPYTKYIKQRTSGVKSARFLNWLFFI